MQTRILPLLAGVVLFAACEDSGKDGMLTTDLGTRYSYVSSNDDGQLATPGDYVYFQAQVKNEGDSVLIDTRDNPNDKPVIQALSDSLINEETSPVQDVVSKMRVGERAVIRADISQFPPQAKPPGMQNDSVMLYDIEVTEIVGQDEFMQRQEAMRAEAEAAMEEVRAREPEIRAFTEEVYNDYKAGRLDGELQEAEGGLRYIIHEEGDGPQAEAGRGVVVQYLGRLTSNGEIFDQSFERGQGIPFQLGAGRVIPGWDEGIALLKQGDHATLIIPSELAYGAQGAGSGSIPPDSELMFYVELEEVQ